MLIAHVENTPGVRVEFTMRGSRGDRGSGSPLENHEYIGFLSNTSP